MLIELAHPQATDAVTYPAMFSPVQYSPYVGSSLCPSNYYESYNSGMTYIDVNVGKQKVQMRIAKEKK